MAVNALISPAPSVRSVPPLPGRPIVGNLLEFRRDRLAIHERAAATGPFVRIQLAHIPLYIASDADIAHRVLVDDAASYRKSAGLQYLIPLLGDGLLTAEGATHKRHRKLLAPAFAPKRLAGYGEVMVDETTRHLATWRPGSEIDLAHHMMMLTLAIAGRTLFGADVRADSAQVGDALEMAMRSMVATITSPIQLGYRWPLPRHNRMRRAVRMLDDVVYRVIADGRARGGDHGDVLSMLLLATDDDGSRLTDREVRDEVMTLLLAGHETTANALAWTWYELGRHPAILAQLTADVRTAIGAAAATPESVARVPLLLAVIEEAMRLHPPAYMIGREAIREVELAGHRLPARSIVAINVRGIHRRADYFADPLTFDPWRMFADAKKARPRHHYLPFGAGPRVCIGSHFALLEAQLVLATMLQRSELAVSPLARDAEPLVTLRPRGGLPARVVGC